MMGLLGRFMARLRAADQPPPTPGDAPPAAIPGEALPSVIIPRREEPATAPLVTAALLRRLGWTTPDLWASVLPPAMAEWGITERLDIAHFLAQVGHESGGGRFMREIWGPTPAQTRYEGREDLGNTQPGDGRRFAGRGLIQITGRHNVTRARDEMKPDLGLDAFLRWLETPEGAAAAACWYWHDRGITHSALRDGLDAVTRSVNGGLNGIKDRAERLAAAKAALGMEDKA